MLTLKKRNRPATLLKTTRNMPATLFAKQKEHPATLCKQRAHTWRPSFNTKTHPAALFHNNSKKGNARSANKNKQRCDLKENNTPATFFPQTKNNTPGGALSNQKRARRRSSPKNTSGDVLILQQNRRQATLFKQRENMGAMFLKQKNTPSDALSTNKTHPATFP